MTVRDQEEQDTHIALMEAQMQKLNFDIEAWKTEQATRDRQLTRQTWTIILSAIGLVIGAFAAGAAWWNYFGSFHH